KQSISPMVMGDHRGGRSFSETTGPEKRHCSSRGQGCDLGLMWHPPAMPLPLRTEPDPGRIPSYDSKQEIMPAGVERWAWNPLRLTDASRRSPPSAAICSGWLESSAGD